MNSASQQGAFTAEGSGVIENVFPGEYRVWIMEGLRQDLDYYVKEATFDRMDALNGFAQITSSVNSTLNVTLSVKGGRIEGTLVDALSKPIAGAPVVLVPDQSRHRDELYRNVETDKEGKFTMRGIPPGSYKLFAWEEIEGSGWFNPDVVARYEHLGKAVRIQESSKEIVEVRIIPATQQ